MLHSNILTELEDYIKLHLFDICYYMNAPYDTKDRTCRLFRYTAAAPFKEMLFDYIDRSGASDPDNYKKAVVDRKLFSKISSNDSYKPRKKTVIALALAL